MGSLQSYLNGPQFKWAPNNNIGPGSLGPLTLIFTNQFKRNNPSEINGFISNIF